MTHDWPALVAEHGPTVWRAARRVLGDEAEAADCFQDTFIAAWELAARQEVRHWPALLRGIAVRRAVDRLRQRVRRDRRTTDALPELVADAAASPLERAQAAELAERLREAIARLPEQQASVFCLRCVEGMSYDEIAAALELTVNHVGVVLSRARAQLRLMLEGSAIAESSRGTARCDDD